MNQIQINGQIYKVLQGLGQGSFGTVVKAQNLSNNQIVAIKLQNKINESELMLIRKFQGKNFKNLVNIYDFEILNDRISIVMELGEKSLQDKINVSKIDPKEVRYLMKQIANGIQELHSLKIAHRDLKPENILIFTKRDSDQIQEIYKICDFGTSKDYSKIQTPYIGTPYYLAPEQLALFNNNQPRVYKESVDIWAFGALMFELFTGSPLFNGQSIQEIYFKIQTLQIEKKLLQLNLEDEYKQLLLKMLQRDPEQRISILDIKNRLSAIQSSNQLIISKRVDQPSFNQSQRGRELNQQQNQQLIQQKLQNRQQNQCQIQKTELQKVNQRVNLQQSFFQNKQNIQNQINLKQVVINNSQNPTNQEQRGRSINQNARVLQRYNFLSPPLK